MSIDKHRLHLRVELHNVKIFYYSICYFDVKLNHDMILKLLWHSMKNPAVYFLLFQHLYSQATYMC